VHQEWLQDPKSLHLIQQLQNKAQAPPGYSWLQDELRYKGRLYLSKQSKLKSTVLSEIHATPTAGHSGFTKTYAFSKKGRRSPKVTTKRYVNTGNKGFLQFTKQIKNNLG
jgi:hypothetical protein